MDFRYYVYNTDKNWKSMLGIKIFNIFWLGALVAVLFLVNPVAELLSISNPILNSKFDSTLLLMTFDTTNNIILSACYIFGAFLFLCLWFTCFGKAGKTNKFIKKGSNFHMKRGGIFFLSNILDLLFLGWLVLVCTKKKTIMNLYNYGVDEWLKQSYAQTQQITNVY